MGGAGKKKYQRTCDYCGKQFRASRHHARSCTARCRASASRERRALSAPPPALVRFVVSRPQASRLLALVDAACGEATQGDADALVELGARLEEALDY